MSSLKDLNKKELQKAVDFFGVEVDPNSSKSTLVAALTADGVTYTDYQKFLVPDEDVQDDDEPVAVEEEAPQPVAPPKRVLVKMDRANPIFEIGKYRFTRKHPFQLVDERDVDMVVRQYPGFSIATPREAQDYYS